jgi:hypothetical protein
VVANHQVRINLKPECRCRTPVGGKACRDRRNSAKTGGGSRGPQICGGHAVRPTSRSSRAAAARNATNRRNQLGAQYSICRGLCGTMKLTS